MKLVVVSIPEATDLSLVTVGTKPVTINAEGLIIEGGEVFSVSHIKDVELVPHTHTIASETSIAP